MRKLLIVAAVVAAAVQASAQSGATSLALTTKPSPLGLGQNVFEVMVRDAKGQPVTNADVAIVLVMPADPKTKHPEMKTEGKLNNIGKGTYNGIVMVTMAGEWEVTITASRDGKSIGQKKERLTAYLTRPKPPAARGK